ncbi:glycine zipper 2TM domain-containing protein [Erythrobacter sp. BLCC-B19]|uniref:glycine zipper 2TM domain-containing protein n=1 Tax=Erythrobacter sp. BLCC-B19 TaxID=3025315 RepID=UPI00235ED46A|nr:glycine zipper 2TM domain-containing protein [Erythrobacter sp. BLCC-B19]WDA40350.1 glycine zipper 2TM domain-containing protein [Erythrobacter sp. BLCC-B19]
MKKLALIVATASMALPMGVPAAQAAELPRAAAPAPSAFAATDANSLPLTADIAEHRKRKRIYDDRGRYYEPRRLGRNDRIWRDGNRYYCRRDNGTTGLVIGAGVGALLGRTVDTRGDRTVGTLLGAIGGGLLGREIDRGELRCR